MFLTRGKYSWPLDQLDSRTVSMSLSIQRPPISILSDYVSREPACLLVSLWSPMCIWSSVLTHPSCLVGCSSFILTGFVRLRYRHRGEQRAVQLHPWSRVRRRLRQHGRQPWGRIYPHSPRGPRHRWHLRQLVWLEEPCSRGFRFRSLDCWSWDHNSVMLSCRHSLTTYFFRKKMSQKGGGERQGWKGYLKLKSDHLAVQALSFQGKCHTPQPKIDFG